MRVTPNMSARGCSLNYHLLKYVTEIQKKVAECAGRGHSGEWRPAYVVGRFFTVIGIIVGYAFQYKHPSSKHLCPSRSCYQSLSAKDGSHYDQNDDQTVRSRVLPAGSRSWPKTLQSYAFGLRCQWMLTPSFETKGCPKAAFLSQVSVRRDAVHI
jgi:hypothetical protein